MTSQISQKWNKVLLKDIVTFKTGKLNSNSATKDGRYPFFTCSQEVYKTDTFSFDTECVLLGGNNANAIYPIFYYKGKFDAYQRTYVIESKNNNVRFLFYLLKQKLNDFRLVSTGSATKFLTLGILNETSVQLPDVTTQKQIADVLFTYDDLIFNNNRRIAILEEIARKIYTEWFVNFRFPEYGKTKMVDSKTEFGMIPKDWEIKKIGDVIDTVGGGTPSTVNKLYWQDGSINWYSPTDITSSKRIFLNESTKKINELGLKNSSAKIFPKFSLMMTSRATIGEIAINSEVASTNQGFIVCIPNEITSVYQLYFWVKLNKKKISSIATGATFKEINKTVFRNMDIILPSKDLSTSFDNQIEPLFQKIRNLEAIVSNLKKTRDLLVSQLVTGKLEIKS